MSTLQIGPRHRFLEHYPSSGWRTWYLALAVGATIMLYYETYILPSVSVQVITEFKITAQTYVGLLLLTNLIGALSAAFGSLSDRIGRSNLIVYGLLVTGIGTLSITFVHSLPLFLVVLAVLGFIEGVILVATPALVRDFSPRFGRAFAMGFWTVGPVGGSVLATTVASLTLTPTTAWQTEYTIAGIVGLIVFVICFLFLRELSPGMRDQIMNSSKEKEAIESRANSIDTEAATKHPWRQMLTPRVIFSSLGVSLFLLIYYAAVGFFPLYLQRIFGFTAAEANGAVSFFWVVNVAAAILIGFISDRTLVRKPYMLAGGIATVIVTLLFITRLNGHVGVPTSEGLMIVFLSLFGLTLAVGYVSWLAAFTETIEDINPALVATGLSVQGAILRLVVVFSTVGFIFTVTGQQTDAAQWGTWWVVCAVGAILYIPTIFMIRGYWRPASSRAAVAAEQKAEVNVEPA
jgi:MFS family permease